jgi:hypothetical protein
VTPRAATIGYALILAFGIAAGIVLTGCHLGPKGRAAVAATTTIRALDAACSAFLDTIPQHVDRSVAECRPQPDPVACFNGRVEARQKAVKACRVYGAARAAGSGDWEALAGEARKALGAIGL